MGILGCELRCVLRTAIATCKFTKIYPLIGPTRHVAPREFAQFCARHLYPMARLEFGDCEIPIVPAKVARTAFHIINIVSSYSSALHTEHALGASQLCVVEAASTAGSSIISVRITGKRTLRKGRTVTMADPYPSNRSCSCCDRDSHNTIRGCCSNAAHSVSRLPTSQ